MASLLKESKLTVQGVGSPVPASSGSEQAGSQTSSTNDRNISVVEPLATGIDNDTRTKKEEALDRLGSKIVALAGFIRGKNNVHMEIRKLVNSIQTCYSQVINQVDHSLVADGGQRAVAIKETQTSPGLLMHATSGKKRRAPSTPKEDKTPKKTKKRALNLTRPSDTPEGIQREAQVGEKLEWRVVNRKKRKPVPKQIKPDALVIKAVGDKSYADILRQMKTDPSLSVLGACVTKVRRNVTGDLLLELSRKAGSTRTELKAVAERALGGVAEVKSLTHETQIELKDLDEVTTSQ